MMTPTGEAYMNKLSSFPGKWNEVLSEEKGKPYFRYLIGNVAEEYDTRVIYPPIDEVYSALNQCSFDDVKVVIIGQDPYINEHQANGLAFSVKTGEKLPPSLLNIYKELNKEYGYPISSDGCLDKWARQGVLLLNDSLTVRAGESNSHAKLGWNKFVDAIIRKIDESDKSVVYLLWGNYAKKKADGVKSRNARIVFCAHPSPLSASRGFFGSDCFKKVNSHLKELGLSEVDFRIE